MADITQVDDPMDIEEPTMAVAPPAAPIPVLLPIQGNPTPTLVLRHRRIEELTGNRRPKVVNRRNRGSRRTDFEHEGIQHSTESVLEHLCGVDGEVQRYFGDTLATRRDSLIISRPPGRLVFEMSDNRRTFSNAVRRFGQLLQGGNEIYQKISVNYIGPTVDGMGWDSAGLSAEFWNKIGFMFAEKQVFVVFPGQENVNWYFTTNEFDEKHFKAVGAMLAKAVLEKATLPISLSPVVYKLICGRTLRHSDLNFVDPVLWNRLNSTEGRNVYISNEFTFTPIIPDRRNKNIENRRDWSLATIRNRDEIVTEQTYKEWARLQCHFILLQSVNHAARNILMGFYSVIPKRRVVRTLTPEDLQILIEGQMVQAAAMQISPQATGG